MNPFVAAVLARCTPAKLLPRCINMQLAAALLWTCTLLWLELTHPRRNFGRALLAGQWRESKEEVVRLDGIDQNSFRLLLEYIYSGEIWVGGLEELFNLLVSGEHVGLHGLCELCIQRLQQRLDLSNSLQIRLFAAEIGCKELEEAAFDIVLGDFAQVFETCDITCPHFQSLTLLQPRNISPLLRVLATVLLALPV